MIFSECNCGKPSRYLHTDEDGNQVYSCNKYYICPTYDELVAKLDVVLVENIKLRAFRNKINELINLTAEGVDG